MARFPHEIFNLPQERAGYAVQVCAIAWFFNFNRVAGIQGANAQTGSSGETFQSHRRSRHLHGPSFSEEIGAHMPPGKPITDIDKARMRLMLADGYSRPEIAREIGCAMRTIYDYLPVTKRSPEPAKNCRTILCLRCGEPFQSESRENRICKDCTTINREICANDYAPIYEIAIPASKARRAGA
jgi:hypothetical protein